MKTTSFLHGHQCPICELERNCMAQSCSKQPFTFECLPCAQRELLEDTERFAKEARKFIGATLPTENDPQTLIWWKALRSETDGKLKGLAVRARELSKRLGEEA